MASERLIPKKVLDAMRTDNKEALADYASEGGKRNAERQKEKKARQAKFDVIINDLRIKLLEVDAQLQAYSHNELTTVDGDVEPLPRLDSGVIVGLRQIYDELRLQIASLEEERSLIK